MGFNVSWIAVRGKSPASIHTILGVKPTGEFEEVPEDPLMGHVLPTGWYLLCANDYSYVDRAPLAFLSEAAELVTCAVEEHVMVSRASGWMNGVEIWSILHESWEGRYHLKVSGEPPDPFKEIRTRLFEAQSAEGGEDSDVDYIFDVPVEAALALTGYRHDDWVEGAKYERLE